jgi:hypothetical protein
MTSKLSMEININNSPHRALLTSFETHHAIWQRSGATVSLLGRYAPPGAIATDRPLHIVIAAARQDSLTAAVDILNHVLTHGILPPAPVKLAVPMVPAVQAPPLVPENAFTKWFSNTSCRVGFAATKVIIERKRATSTPQ